MADVFPTRQYSYRRDPFLEGPDPVLEAGQLYRFVLGIDDEATGPVVMPPQQAATLKDRFAALLAAGPQPMTGRTLIAALDATGLQRTSFVVSDGGQVPWRPANAGLARQTRVVVAWKDGGALAVLLATSTQLDDAVNFLQVIGWDGAAGHFNFYERRYGAWVWAGDSRNALDPRSRGKGPFDSHVNGGLVMKELKAPWVHWKSQSADQLPGIGPNDPLRQEEVFERAEGAEALEGLVRAGVRRWTVTRFEKATAGDSFGPVPEFLRQVLTTTSFNVITSRQQSTVRPADGRLLLPITPFLDAEGLSDALGIALPPGRFSAPWEHYERVVQEHGYELRDDRDVLAAKGDLHFAFPAPERAFEDQIVLRELLARGLLPERVAACLLMVDFANPVFSRRREALLKHVPEKTRRAAGAWDLGTRLVDAITRNPVPESPEAEFAGLWAAGDAWRAVFAQRLAAFFAALQARLEDRAGFESVARLVASRRLSARGRKLLEFGLTLPRTAKLPDARLRMREDATVEVEGP